MNDYRLTNDGQLDSEDETLRAGNHKSSGTNSNEWLVNVADDVVVPMVTSEVVEALRTGRLNNRSLVWRTGMHDWSALAEVPQLRLAAGPSALPSAASTPGPIVVNKPPKPTAEQRRRNTLPMGFPAVRDATSVQQPAGLSAALSTPVSTPRPEKPKREDSSDALAVYERPAPSLTFSDSVRAEWQGKGRIVNRGAASPAPAAPSTSPAPRRLTPVPVVPTRLPARVARSLPTNTLAPTTAEAETAASTRSVGMWGDRSVVLASELRAAKRTSKRVALWAAVGSALVASGFTFWALHAPLPGFAQGLLPGFAQAPVSSPLPAAAAAREAAPTSLEPTANVAAPATNIAAPAASVVVASPPPVVAATSIPLAVKPAVVMQPRAVKRAKAPAPESTAAAPAAAEFNPYADDTAAGSKPSDSKPSDSKPSDSKPSDSKPSDSKPSDSKPSEAATPPLIAAMANAVHAPAPPGTTAPAEAPKAPPASASTPGF